MFYSNTENSLRDRLLSAQFLLGGSYNLDTQKRKFINQDLEEKMKDNKLEYNIRADIADILSMYGDKRRQRRAERILKKLGFEKGGYTVYDDAQNVHSEEIKTSVHKFIETELSKDHIPMVLYESTTEGRDGSE